MKSWLLRVAAWLSQTVNLFLLFGHHDQTVSARCYCNREAPYWNFAYKTVNLLFFFQEDHCKASHESDIKFAKEVLSNE